jgi:transposase
VDLGNRKSIICVLDFDGAVINMREIPTTVVGFQKCFEELPKAVVVMEAGSHSPWVSRQLEAMGCEVLIGNPRKLRMIWQSQNKSDVRDAEMLARIGRFDRSLLHPIQHRREETQADLAMIKARDMLVQMRTGLINHTRGAVKSAGVCLPICSSASFHQRVGGQIPEGMAEALKPILEQIEACTQAIKAYDRRIETLSREKYPETQLLRQVGGVGPITAMGYVLTLEEAKRFRNSRVVGAYLGLVPRRDQSGETDKQLRITKAGSRYLRRLLVSCSQYILGPFGAESDLRTFGLRLASRGGKNAKRRAIVAVARKLAVLLHRLWTTGEVYDPFYNRKSLLKSVA